MSKIFFIAALFPFLATLTACMVPNPDKKETPGRLRITAAVLPEYNPLAYEAAISSRDGKTITKNWQGDRISGVYDIPAGMWTVELSARNGGEIIATGEKNNVEIISGETTGVAIDLILIDPDGEQDNGDPDEGDPDEGDPVAVDPAGLKLSANAGSGSAYDLIRSNGFDYETPDQTNGGHASVSHIVQQPDLTLGKNVFAFVMHRNEDRNATGDWTRQRVEIKIDHRNGTPGRDYCGLSDADEGRSFIYRWKFRLPADFAVSTDFTHIHQIKNEGGDASQPVVALTARAVSGGADKRMQLTYYAPGSSSPTYWVNAANSLGAYLGQWVQCEESITYSSNKTQAAYSLKITKISDGAELMNYTAPANSIQTWRTGNTHGRPKFGLYRRIFTGGNPGNNTEPDAGNAVSGLKNETVLYADFEAVKSD